MEKRPGSRNHLLLPGLFADTERTKRGVCLWGFCSTFLSSALPSAADAVIPLPQLRHCDPSGDSRLPQVLQGTTARTGTASGSRPATPTASCRCRRTTRAESRNMQKTTRCPFEAPVRHRVGQFPLRWSPCHTGQNRRVWADLSAAFPEKTRSRIKKRRQLRTGSRDICPQCGQNRSAGCGVKYTEKTSRAVGQTVLCLV